MNRNKYRARLFLYQPKQIPRKAPRKVLRRPRKDAQGFLKEIVPAQGCRARFYAGRARPRKDQMLKNICVFCICPYENRHSERPKLHF